MMKGCYFLSEECTACVKLTKTDKLILDSYASMMDGLSAYLGSPYEISLHSLEDYHHSVMKICNGYHSGRSAGAPITDLALNMLKRINDNDLSAIGEYTSYSVINDSGERLKSSTIPIFGENARLIGLLCINLYLDVPASELIQSLFNPDADKHHKERFNNSLSESILAEVAEAKAQVMHDDTVHSTNKNKEIIRILYNKGIFDIKDSVMQVADILGISKNTVYLHLRKLESGK